MAKFIIQNLIRIYKNPPKIVFLHTEERFKQKARKPMIKQPQDKTEFHQSDCLDDDNITLYDHQADSALSDNQLNAALKEGKSIF